MSARQMWGTGKVLFNFLFNKVALDSSEVLGVTKLILRLLVNYYYFQILVDSQKLCQHQSLH